MALVAHFDLELYQMDVKITFLNRNQSKDVFIINSIFLLFLENKTYYANYINLSMESSRLPRQWYLKFD